MPNPYIGGYAKERQKGKDPLIKQRSIRMTEKMSAALANLDRDWTDIAREAIAIELRKKGIEVE
ncbi:MAG: hypothetical protein ACRC2R_12555 [Xenococcaceae cyanobacterium]|jgi:hypothetical protein